MREFTQMRNLLIADSVALHLDVKAVVVNMSVKYIVGNNMSIGFVLHTFIPFSLHLQTIWIPLMYVLSYLLPMR